MRQTFLPITAIGLLVALIANNKPINIVITILFAALQVGAIGMQVFTSLPSEITSPAVTILLLRHNSSEQQEGIKVGRGV